MLRLEAIRKVVPSPGRGEPLVVLDGVDLAVGAGEKVAILGRSGSGKSTLLSIVGLLDAATSGRYAIAGDDVTALRPRQQDERRARTFGFVFQRFCLFGHLSAAENVEAALAHAKQRRGRRSRALAALDAVGLASRAAHRPAQLSGGEQQRVALARALVTEPPVLLADEPTGALDESTGATVIRLMHELAERCGTALVVVTHDPVVVGGFDRTVTLERGRTVPS